VGKIRVCSGYTKTGGDWAVVEVAYLRRGDNKYPLYSESKNIAEIPKSIGFPIATDLFAPQGGHPVNDPQTICYLGRTSGLTLGSLRALRTVKIFRGKQKNIYQIRLFWSVKMTMSRDGGRARRGDSGSWIYETASGKPFLMLTAMCGMSEGLGITLDEVFLILNNGVESRLFCTLVPRIDILRLRMIMILD